MVIQSALLLFLRKSGKKCLNLHVHGGVKHIALCLKPSVAAALAGHCLDGTESHTKIIPFAREIFSVFLFEVSMEAVVHDDGQEAHIHSTGETDKLFSLCHPATGLQGIFHEISKDDAQFRVCDLLCLGWD